MNFEVDRYTSAWAHTALCADLTWASEPPDAFVLANQRLWAQHCRITRLLQESSNSLFNHTDTGKRFDPSLENGCFGGKTVKDVIPDSRLAQYYGNFVYDEARESCYSNVNYKSSDRYNGYGYESSDQTECWMLPEVEYWFRKLVDDSSERSMNPRRRRQYKSTVEDDFERAASSGERATEENTLKARIRSVRSLWHQNYPQATQPSAPPRPPSPPATSRKMRARRRQPRRFSTFASPPAHCIGVPNQLFCDSSYKFQLDVSRQHQTRDLRRAMGRVSSNCQSIARGTSSRCQPYRGTQVSRYTPAYQRTVRCPDKKYGIWWQRGNTLMTSDSNHLDKPQNIDIKKLNETAKKDIDTEESIDNVLAPGEMSQGTNVSKLNEEKPEASESHTPSTNTSKMEIERKKRLYSTVLSMSPPSPINMNAINSDRLGQKFTPGLIKLNPKIVFAARRRPSNTDKFEELEKQALEQYKASDESIDTKFRELERQAVEQYSTSNSNTSCSSENSTKTKLSQETQTQSKSKQSSKSHKQKSLDSVVIYSQNFPDLNSKGRTKSIASLKNFHAPQRGEKKEQIHRMSKSFRNHKAEIQRAASDTDYDAQEIASKGNYKSSIRWTLHGIHPKKRHLSLSVSDLSSDDEEGTCKSMKGVRPSMKNHIKAKMFAHGAGDLQTTKNLP